MRDTTTGPESFVPIDENLISIESKNFNGHSEHIRG